MSMSFSESILICCVFITVNTKINKQVLILPKMILPKYPEMRSNICLRK